MRQTFQSTISFYELLFNNIDAGVKSTQSFAKKNFLSKINLPKFRNPISPKIMHIIIGVFLFVGVIWFFQNNNFSTSAGNSTKPLAPVAKETQTINKIFNFPIKDNAGKEVSKIKYEIQSATLQDEILVKGQRARSVQGRTFLIINIKISNTFDQGIQINSKDYVRLIVNGKKEELIAADIHNDPVEVQAISTKTTRIGFPINETDRDLALQVGEINGKKETIKLTFSN